MDNAGDRATQIETFEQSTANVSVGDGSLQFACWIDHKNNPNRNLIQITDRLLNRGFKWQDGLLPKLFWLVQPYNLSRSNSKASADLNPDAAPRKVASALIAS